MFRYQTRNRTIADFVRSSYLPSMTPAQCRAARALLRWSQEDLARTAEINAVTLRNYENEKTTAQRASISVMRQAFETAGVVFTESDRELGPGVALRRVPSLS